MSIKDRLGAFSEFIETRLQRAKESNGEDETNPMYIQATDIRLSKKQPSDSVHVDITYEKETFKNRALEWGPLDLDREKSTVLVKTKNGIWISFWFYKKDVEGLNNLLTRISS